MYCPELRLAVEIDGGGHSDPHQANADAERSRWLEKQGIAVRRYWNHDVLDRTPVVLEDLLNYVEERRQAVEAERLERARLVDSRTEPEDRAG